MRDTLAVLPSVESSSALDGLASPLLFSLGAMFVRILIADDDRTSTLLLGRTLEQWGFEVVAAQDGLEAWESILGDKPPALAIVDWMMPRLDGIELCQRIRATSLRSPVYVILLTARTSRQDLVAGLEAGADDYLTKPFERDELRARIHVGQRTLGLMANIKQLSGLLPICSYCKRIRSDTDYWEQVESYISDHTDARFSHGICPPCLAKAMGEVDSPAVPTLESGL
jgi:sigma-B regulation protein RsbU (phosphoserine phosphatase)